MPYKTDQIRKAVWANRNKKMKKKALYIASWLGEEAGNRTKQKREENGRNHGNG